MALALDGSSHTTSGAGNTLVCNGLTCASGDVVVACVLVLSSFDAHITSISSSNTTGWAQRGRVTFSSGNNAILMWFGKSTGALSNEAITINVDGTPAGISADVFGISGADTTTINDSNGALPATSNTSGNTVALTTSNANDFLIGFYGFNSTANPTQGSGWTVDLWR
jgi:hypothetical protein